MPQSNANAVQNRDSTDTPATKGLSPPAWLLHLPHYERPTLATAQKQTPTFNRRNWYTADEIDERLRTIAKPSQDPEIEISPAMRSTDRNESSTPATNYIQKFKDQRSLDYIDGRQMKSGLLIPINIFKCFWHLLYLEFTKDSLEAPIITYIQPSDGKLLESLYPYLQTIFPKSKIRCCSTSLYEFKRLDNSQWVVETALTMSQRAPSSVQDSKRKREAYDQRANVEAGLTDGQENCPPYKKPGREEPKQKTDTTKTSGHQTAGGSSSTLWKLPPKRLPQNQRLLTDITFQINNPRSGS